MSKNLKIDAQHPEMYEVGQDLPKSSMTACELEGLQSGYGSGLHCSEENEAPRVGAPQKA